jgi:hypothetical protein
VTRRHWARACGEPPLYGLIQHSFALQLPEGHRPFRGRTNSERVAERFDTGRFRARWLDEVAKLDKGSYTGHSPLAHDGWTTLQSLEPRYIGPGPPITKKLPEAFQWAENDSKNERDRYEEPRLIFADEFDRPGHFSISDFLVTDAKDLDEAEPVSRLLLELMAHKRSRLFGFALANRFVNVMLPYAVIEPDESDGAQPVSGTWLVQPLLSFIRGGRVRSRLRSTYSLTLFMVPVARQTSPFAKRPISIPEIAEITNPGWGFAAFAADSLDRFKVSDVSGSLIGYLSQLSGLEPRTVLDLPNKTVTLRALIETVAFGIGLGIAQRRTDRDDLAITKRIGNDVIMSLGNARVSSVVVSDPTLKPNEVRRPVKQFPFPGILAVLLHKLSDTIRPPEEDDEKAYRWRLDRPGVDNDIYAVGVLPTKRCMVVASCGDAQHGTRESALMQAGSVAYMTLGAATAIGTMRELDRRLEHLEGANDPLKIARIDAEVAADLGEIYDLDITRESYRKMYRRLRVRLGIARDYKTLQDRMETLYRATSTFHEDKEEKMLVVLTAAIVILSVLILIGTAVIASHGG